MDKNIINLHKCCMSFQTRGYSTAVAASIVRVHDVGGTRLGSNMSKRTGSQSTFRFSLKVMDRTEVRSEPAAEHNELHPDTGVARSSQRTACYTATTNYKLNH